jgi:hypothetical protein
MSINNLFVRCCILPVLLTVCGAVNAQTITVNDPRPVHQAVLKLEAIYGWAITYEDLPYIHESDLEDVTSRVRRDGKSATEPGIKKILAPRGGAFSFSVDGGLKLDPGTRTPEAIIRAAILEMLKSYSASIGGAEMFALTDSNGLFHVVPVQCKNASGKLEKIVPLLDTPVNIPPGRRTGMELLFEICRSVTSQTGRQLSGPGWAINALMNYNTEIGSAPNETARSLLSRLFADMARPRPFSWGLLCDGSGSCALNVHIVDVGK